MNKPFDKWAVLVLLAVGMIAADQVTKFLAVEHLTWLFRAVRADSLGARVHAFVAERDLLERGLRKNDFVQVLPFWQNLYTQNRAAAFGLLGFVPGAVRLPLFYVIAVVAVVFLFRFYRGLETRQRFLQFAVGLTLGGALGNALDRVLHGYVIDFIDWHWFDPDWMKPHLHWPTFNVADSGISVGLVLLALDAFVARKPHGQAGVNQPAAKRV